MQLGGTLLAIIFMLRTMRLLAGRIAIFDELATVTPLEVVTTRTTSGAFLRVIGSAHDYFHRWVGSIFSLAMERKVNMRGID